MTHEIKKCTAVISGGIFSDYLLWSIFHYTYFNKCHLQPSIFYHLLFGITRLRLSRERIENGLQIKSYFCLVFKWSDHMIRPIIPILTFQTIKGTFFLAFRLPLDNQTCLDHSNTRLVRYSDGQSILMICLVWYLPRLQ